MRLVIKVGTPSAKNFLAMPSPEFLTAPVTNAHFFFISFLSQINIYI